MNIIIHSKEDRMEYVMKKKEERETRAILFDLLCAKKRKQKQYQRSK